MESIPITTVEKMATRYIDAVRTVQPQGPYLLGGYSAGGIIAYEMAQQLRAEGQSIALLAIIDAAPVYPRNTKEHYSAQDADVMTAIAEIVGRYFDQDMSQLLNEGALESQLVKFLAGQLVAPPEMVRELLEDVANVVKTLPQAINDYRLEPYDGHITLLATEESLEKIRQDPLEQALGWGALAKSGVDVHQTEGDHITLMREPYVRALAETLERSIRQSL